MDTRFRRLSRIGVVILIAAGAGQYMQSGTDASAPRAAAAPPAAPAADARGAAADPALLPAAAATPLVEGWALVAAAAPAPAADAAAGPRAAPETVTRGDRIDIVAPPPAGAPLAIFAYPAPAAAAPVAPAADPPSAAAAPSQAALAAAPCLEALDAVATPGAMLTLVLTAPCRPEARVVLRHAGLAVTARTSAAGTLTAMLPALDPAGSVAVQFDDGRRVTAAAPVSDLGGLTRFAVQWMGPDAFALHASAGDADVDSPGHVHAGAPGVRGGAAGHLAVLGDASVDRPLLAQVYTFPADAAAVQLQVEAAITPETCGRDLLGETLQWSDGRTIVRDLTMTMPACDEGGGYLVLQNPLADLKLAGN